MYEIYRRCHVMNTGIQFSKGASALRVLDTSTHRISHCLTLGLQGGIGKWFTVLEMVRQGSLILVN